jgi:hypothetical protein
MSSFLKVLAIVVTLVGAVFVAGLTGVLFAVWPTSWPDQQLPVTDSEIAALQRLRAEHKFYPDAKLFYPGAIDEATRARCDALVNDLLSQLIASVKTTPRKSRVLSALKATLSNASRLDSEEQDRLGSYVEEILRILDIDSSNELINVWRYGFPYGWFRSSELKAPGDR